MSKPNKTATYQNAKVMKGVIVNKQYTFENLHLSALFFLMSSL